MSDLWQRLKQRKLVQWAVAYVAFAFALIQVADVVAGSYHWPDHAMHVVFGLLVLGFAVTLILAWYHGERGAQKVSRPELLLIALVLAVGGGSLWYFGELNLPAAVGNVAATAQAAIRTKPAPAVPVPFNPPADTLVVLPFQNLSGDPEQQYFSDGITEELTGALGRDSGLRVIAWDTASRYRNGTESPGVVGKDLNVANLLHGSIERENGMVRVSAELVDTRSGYELWSAHYDDTLSNIFQVQDKISASIALALKVKFASTGHALMVNPQAHDLVLKARALIQTSAITATSDEQARKLFEQAIALDPDYADAHAGLAHALYELTGFSTLSLQQTLPRIRGEADKALALDPRNVDALLDLGVADEAVGKIDKARAAYAQALAIDPSSAEGHMDYANVLPLKPLLPQVQKALQLDPDNVIAQLNSSWYALDVGKYRQALSPAKAVIKLAPHSANGAFRLALAWSLLHRNQDAVKAFDQVQPDTASGEAQVAAGRLTYQSVLDPELHAQALAAVDKLHTHADLDAFSLVNLIQLYLVLGKNDMALKLLPEVCTASPVTCNDLSLYPQWLPLHGDPRFQVLVKKYDTMSESP
ncbi:MAG TPA: tetratricopeptide repeat protein [Rhodanobacter sp.]|nr:tetratricopeptide repeat protein [Rhodanobacter sp.]